MVRDGVDIDGKPLVKASSYGCGDEVGCLDCYPYFYACDNGHEFAAPVPNDGREDECRECEEEGF